MHQEIQQQCSIHVKGGDNLLRVISSDSHETSPLKLKGQASYINLSDLENIEGEYGQINQEELRKLQHLQRLLCQQEIVKHNYKNQVEKANKSLQTVINSKIPTHIKEKMMESIRESLTTTMNCLAEINKEIKEMILNLEKLNNFSAHMNLIQKWKDANRVSKNPSTTSTNLNSSVYTGVDRNYGGENTTKNAQSFWSTHSVADDFTEEKKAVEESRKEKEKLEEVIANLKQTKNLLEVGIENMRDNTIEYEGLIQERKTNLEKKLSYIENLKSRISTTSSKKSSHLKLFQVFKTSSGVETERNERSVSRVNTTVFQEVSSKVSSLFGRVFKGKNKEPVVGKVLTTEFLNDLNLQTMPSNSRRSRDSKDSKESSRPSTLRSSKP